MLHVCLGFSAGDMDHGALRKGKNCPYINEKRHVMECLVLASNAATNSLTIAVIIFLKSLNTLEREEIKAVAHQSHFCERRRLPQPQQMTNPLLQGPPFDPNVGNQVQVNQVDIFMEEFLVVLDLLFDHVQYEV